MKNIKISWVTLRKLIAENPVYIDGAGSIFTKHECVDGDTIYFSDIDLDGETLYCFRFDYNVDKYNELHNIDTNPEDALDPNEPIFEVDNDGSVYVYEYDNKHKLSFYQKFNPVAELFGDL